ncbi:MAG: TOBE domain-containing protein [Sulfurimonas sp.]|jgi:molybdate transport system regulatory protein|nr:TOBE domain-containing protein [Sulfurimonadaceae bacterium]
MKTSARNELNGVVTGIKSGGVMSEVMVQVSPNVTIVSTITNDSKESLALKEGSGVLALIKASMVILSKQKLASSARNNIEAKVLDVIKGAVNSEVKLQLEQKILYSVVTNEAIDDLEIKKNDSLYVMFKASSVILAV